jgi:hypothetical protein
LLTLRGFEAQMLLFAHNLLGNYFAQEEQGTLHSRARGIALQELSGVALSFQL